MRVFRLCKTIYSPGVLDGQGGLIADGRWHSAGRPVVYAASSEALAVLELRVHLGHFLPGVPFTMHALEVPDGLIATLSAKRLPAGWNAVPMTAAAQSTGDAWLAAATTLALRVPSIHSRSDWNLLINPAHPDLRRVKVVARDRHVLDSRLFSQ